MVVFAVTIVVNTSFSLLVRAAQRRHVNVIAVGFVNYVFAAGLYWVLAAATRPAMATPVLTFGIAAGVLYPTVFLLLLPAMHMKGVAITMAIVRLSVLIPLGGALWLWSEMPGEAKTYGIVLALVALPMLSLDKGINDVRLSLRQTGLLVALFLANGACLLMSKAFQMTGLVAQRPLYLAIVFTGGALGCGAVYFLTRKARLKRAELLWGIAVGAANAASNMLLLYTLDVFLAAVVFPILAAVGLCLATMFAAAAWREIPGRLGWAGIAVAVIAVALANSQ